MNSADGQVIRDGDPHPVLCRLSNERTLIPACARVSLNRMSSRSHQVIQFGKFHYQAIPVVLVEWAFFKIVLYKGWFEGPIRLFLERGI